MKRAKGDYMEHAPIVEEDTTTEELLSYVERQTRNPIEEHGCTIYYYSSHTPDYDALKELAEKAEDGDYIVPFQVDSAWSYIWANLPEELRRNADFMFYLAHEQRYKHYPNYYNFKNANLEDEVEYRTEIAEAYKNND